jgi:hypothetical protein
VAVVDAAARAAAVVVTEAVIAVVVETAVEIVAAVIAVGIETEDKQAKRTKSPSSAFCFTSKGFLLTYPEPQLIIHLPKCNFEHYERLKIQDFMPCEDITICPKGIIISSA